MARSMLGAGMGLVTAIDNVHIYVKDMQRSRSFYRELLGIPLEGDDHWQDADLGGVRFALHEAPEGVEPTTGTVKVNFRVADADDAASRLREQGVEVEEQMREEYGVSYKVVDPDGYRVYLFQPPS